MSDTGILMGKQQGVGQDARPAIGITEMEDGRYSLHVSDAAAADSAITLNVISNNQTTLISQNQTMINQNVQIIAALVALSTGGLL